MENKCRLTDGQNVSDEHITLELQGWERVEINTNQFLELVEHPPGQTYQRFQKTRGEGIIGGAMESNTCACKRHHFSFEHRISLTENARFLNTYGSLLSAMPWLFSIGLRHYKKRYRSKWRTIPQPFGLYLKLAMQIVSGTAKCLSVIYIDGWSPIVTSKRGRITCQCGQNRWYGGNHEALGLDLR